MPVNKKLLLQKYQRFGISIVTINSCQPANRLMRLDTAMLSHNTTSSYFQYVIRLCRIIPFDRSLLFFEYKRTFSYVNFENRLCDI